MIKPGAAIYMSRDCRLYSRRSKTRMLLGFSLLSNLELEEGAALGHRFADPDEGTTTYKIALS